MTVTPDQERWAEALAVERLHGTEAGRHVADRVLALAAAGDQRGVERWLQISARLDELGEGKPQ